MTRKFLLLPQLLAILLLRLQPSVAAPPPAQLASVPAAASPSAAPPSAALTFPGQREGDFVAKNFAFASGAKLPEVRLHYTTLGTPHQNAKGEIDNAVLLLHGTTGTGKSFLSPSLGGELFGPGQALDASVYYVILPDGKRLYHDIARPKGEGETQ